MMIVLVEVVGGTLLEANGACVLPLFRSSLGITYLIEFPPREKVL